MRLLAALILSTLIVGQSAIMAEARGQALQSRYPYLKSGSKHCMIVLQAAKDAFNTDEANISQAVGSFRGKNASLVLAAASDGQYDQEEFYVDPKVFTVDKHGENAGITLYIQKEPFEGNRLVVKQSPYAWHQWFHVYAVSDDLSPEDIVDSLTAEKEPSKSFRQMAELYSIKPWVFSDKNNHLLVVTRDEGPAEDNNWRVLDPARTEPIASIVMQPRIKTQLDIIPKGPLKTIEKSLDAMIGPDNPDTHLMGSAALRLRLRDEWTALIIRPWAVSPPVNTRARVDSTMKRWSKMNSKSRSIYGDFMQALPAGETQLAALYQNSFKLDSAKASKLAQHGLDRVIRNSFSFGSQ